MHDYQRNPLDDTKIGLLAGAGKTATISRMPPSNLENVRACPSVIAQIAHDPSGLAAQGTAAHERAEEGVKPSSPTGRTVQAPIELQYLPTPRGKK